MPSFSAYWCGRVGDWSCSRKDTTEISYTTTNNLTPGMRADNLQKNINGMGNFERQNRVNNIIKKWK